MGYDQAAAPLASLSITHVYYDPNDPISLLCAYLALLPQALCVVYLTLILSTREAEPALLFAGQLACEALNFLLKRLIKEDRPRQIHGKGYGMPSSHAQFVAFWSLSLVLFLLVRHQPTSTTTSTTLTKPSSTTTTTARLVLAAVSVVLAAATATSRIYLNYHTPRQVIVGSATGVVFALVWFVATASLRRSGLLDWALDTYPLRALRVRDLIIHEDLSDAGWEKWEARRKIKAIKTR